MDSIKCIFTVAGPVYETVQKNLNLLLFFFASLFILSLFVSALF